MKAKYGVAILLVQLLLLAPTISRATELKEETVKAWEEYVHTANARMEKRLRGDSPFLWVDEVSGGALRVRQGELLVAPAEDSSPAKVPHGMIHDWVGAMFIPQVTVEDVFAVVNDYDRYPEIYKPAVMGAKLLSSAGSARKFSMVMVQRVLSVTASVDGEYQSDCFQLDEDRWYCISYSTCLREIKNFSQGNEHELPPDQGSGYVWRLYSITRFQQRDGGVYAELEAIGLSRDIPFEIRWLVQPIVERLPRNAVSLTLEETRSSVQTNVETSRQNSTRPGTAGDSCGRGQIVNNGAHCPSASEATAHRPNYSGMLPIR